MNQLSQGEQTLVALTAAAMAGAVAFGLLVYLTKRFNKNLERRLEHAVEPSVKRTDEERPRPGGLLGILVTLARRVRHIGFLGGLMARATTPARLRVAAKKLDAAGLRGQLEPRDLVEAQLVGAVGGFLLVTLAGGGLTPKNLLYGAVVGAVTWRLSMIPLTNATQRRQNRIRGALPKAADIMVVAVEAGLTLDKAMGLYCERFAGPLADELNRIQEDIRIGYRRGDAFRSAIARVDIEDLSRFLGAILLAERFGVPVAMVLRTQSNELKQLRSQRIRESSMKAPIKMLIPTVALIMPALFIILLGPMAIVMATGGLFQ
jgi:tight adherence protein C